MALFGFFVTEYDVTTVSADDIHLSEHEIIINNEILSILLIISKIYPLYSINKHKE
jgi:hypothetical protein